MALVEVLLLNLSAVITRLYPGRQMLQLFPVKLPEQVQTAAAVMEE
jgi:hypothetical protein